MVSITAVVVIILYLRFILVHLNEDDVIIRVYYVQYTVLYSYWVVLGVVLRRTTLTVSKNAGVSFNLKSRLDRLPTALRLMHMYSASFF